MELLTFQKNQNHQAIAKINEAYPIYFSSDYHRYENSIGFETGFIHHNGVIFPYRIYKKLFFKSIQFLHPPINDKAELLAAEKEKDFSELVLKFLREKSEFHRVAQPFTNEVFNAIPSGATGAPFGKFFLPLEGRTEDELLMAFQPRARRSIKEVIKESEHIEVKFGREQLDVLYPMYQRLHQKQSLFAEPLSTLKSQSEILGNKHCLISMIYDHGNPEGGVMALYTEREACTFHGAVADKTRLQGSLRYLYWEMIRKFHASGVKTIAFGGARLSDVSGTKLQGIQDFKSRMGAKIRKGYIWKADLQPTICKAFDLMLTAGLKIKGLKTGPDVIDYEKNRQPIVN
ncbi:MAG: hypothetical protein RLZZ46_1771, partial [Bacteroidota bacterium]